MPPVTRISGFVHLSFILLLVAGGAVAGCPDHAATKIDAGTLPWPVFDTVNYPPAVSPSTKGNTYYVDTNRGSDRNSGTSLESPFRTIARALPLVGPGDTVLIRKGIYREGINLNNRSSGSPGKPITFGSFGDGEVILDGSTKVGPWTPVSSSIWQAAVSFPPVAVVVNSLPLKQVRRASEVTACSGTWHVASGVITADFGAAGAGDANAADVVVPNSTGDQQHVYFYGQNHIVFKGLTIRGSGSNGIWGQGSHITVESCKIQFNSKAAVAFQGRGNTDNKVLTSHVYHNVLINWPRGNNGYDSSGGGWPGTLVWYANLRPLARGNVVHMNGGEGILSYGSPNGVETGSALFEQNVVFDNWSVNLYFDNQPNGVARSNIIFNHAPDVANFVDGKASLAKFSVCLMLADEYNSGDSATGFANLSGSSVYNNIIAGCRIGIRDYSEGRPTQANHGLRNTVIANNTIIMPIDRSPYNKAASDIFGIFLQDNGTRNVNTRILNNIVLGFTNDVLMASAGSPSPGIVFDNNIYWNASGTSVFSSGLGWRRQDFAAWKESVRSDARSHWQDPLLEDARQFITQRAIAFDYSKARPLKNSPTRQAGTPLSFFNSNIEGAPRSSWGIGAH
jgi:hypothetical protein